MESCFSNHLYTVYAIIPPSRRCQRDSIQGPILGVIEHSSSILCIKRDKIALWKVFIGRQKTPHRPYSMYVCMYVTLNVLKTKNPRVTDITGKKNTIRKCDSMSLIWMFQDTKKRREAKKIINLVPVPTFMSHHDRLANPILQADATSDTPLRNGFPKRHQRPPKFHFIHILARR